MISLLTSSLPLASSGSPAEWVWVLIPIVAIVGGISSKIISEFRSNPRPRGLAKEDLATLKRISEMLDKMESRVDALEVILSESNAQKQIQPSKTQAYGNQR
jgi:phage shock protein B